MKQKLLKLIKILKRFTLDDLQIMSNFDSNDINSNIQDFMQDGTINKISKTEYAYIQQIPSVGQQTGNSTRQSNYCKIKKSKIDLSQINTVEFFPKEDELKIYNEAPEYAKPYLIKYTTILRLSGKLRGDALRKFINKLATEHPEYKVSYSTLLRLRCDYVKYGLKGLIPKYGKSANLTVVPTEMYEEFKHLYLNQNKYSINKCLKILAESHKYEIIPSGGCFKRLLKKEFTPELIEQMRNIPLQLPSLKIEPKEQIVIKENKNSTNRTDSFAEGAKMFLNDLKNKNSETEICRCGYIKNHLIPYYKSFKFKDITQEVISKYVSVKLAEGYSIASIGRFISTLSLIIEKYSTSQRQFNFSNTSASSYLVNVDILSDTEIKKISKNNSPELWYLALGVKPAELDALSYDDINFLNKSVIINKIRVNGRIQKYRTMYQIRELKIPKIIFSKLIPSKGKLFNDINTNNYDVILNTHIKILIDKNVQINIISKMLGFQSLTDFESRYNFLLPQKLNDKFEII